MISILVAKLINTTMFLYQATLFWSNKILNQLYKETKFILPKILNSTQD